MQLTGAAKTNSVANLQVRMPVVVIGGGLTAIDTATESHGVLSAAGGEVPGALREARRRSKGERRRARGLERGGDARLRRSFSRTPGRSAAERALAAREGREPDLIGLMNSWGGVTLAYRRRLIDSPSYTLNHEEIAKALEEGVQFAECLNPHAVEVDELWSGHARWS